ncbi:MAG: peptide ABC transporter substrate-binding protein [Gemmatimonadaceae bacterium]
MMHSVRAASTLSLALSGILCACGAPVRPDATAVLASGADLESANPLVTVHPMSRQVQRHALFVTLVRLDSLLQPMPYYARTWTWDATKQRLTFVLRSGLHWHDGEPTNARDVQFTYESLRDKSLGAPRAADISAVTTINVVNDTTIEFAFAAPQPSLPVVFAELALVPRHLLDTVPLSRWRAHSFSTNPVGNGPFKFAERVAGRRWRFVRNDEFPADMGGPPRLAQFVVAVVDEPATKFAGLVSGELDMAGISPAMARLVAGDSTLALETPPALFSTLIAFNTTRAPFVDARVRRAISLSLDRQRVVDAAVAGFGTPAAGAIPPGVPVYQKGTPARDTTLANSLLDAAGWPRNARGIRTKAGVPLHINLLTVGSGDLAAEQLVQADLRERGIELDVQVRELATFLSQVRASKKEFDAAYVGVPGDLALGHIVAMFQSTQKGGALDYTGFHSDALDAALTSARVSNAGEPAMRAWAVVDSLLLQDSPAAWVYHSRGVQGRSRKLHNVVMDLRGELTSIATWTRDDKTTSQSSTPPHN